MASFRITRWNAARDGPLSIESMGQKLKSKGYQYMQHKYEAGTVLQEHAHKEPRKDAVISGELKVSMSGHEVVLKAGEVLDVPVGVEHTATVVGEKPVVVLEGELTNLEVEHWDAANDGHLSLETMAKKLASQGFTFMQQAYGPGTVLHDHAHREPTKDAVVSGRLKVELFGKEVVLEPGDMIEIPAGVQHATNVVGSEICVMYESAIVDLVVEHWSTVKDGAFTVDAMAQKLKSMGYHYVQEEYAPGTIFHEHAHECAMKRAVISGQLKVRMQSKEMILQPGDILDFPAGIEYNAEVVGSTDTIVFDAEKGHIHRIHWNPAVDGQLTVENVAKKLESRGYNHTLQNFLPGTVHDEHSHKDPCMDAVVSGQMKVRLFGQEIILNPGDMLEIPMGITHKMEVIGSEPVVALEGVLGGLKVDSWDVSRDGAFSIENLGKKLKARGYYYKQHEHAPGAVHHDHAHPEPRQEAIVSGQLKFGMHEKEVVLKAGDIIAIPIGIDHNTTVVGAESVVVLDAIKGDIKVERWNLGTDGPPTVEGLTKKLKAHGYHCMQEEYNPGTVLHEHAHNEPRKDAVVSGQLKVGVFGKEVVLNPGDIIDIPEGIDHDAAVVGNQPVVLLEASK